MSWYSDWKILSGRILEFVETVNNFAPTPIYTPATHGSTILGDWTNEADPFGIKDTFLNPVAKKIYEALTEFLNNHKSSLQEDASDILTDFCQTHSGVLSFNPKKPTYNLNHLRSQAALLAGLRAEFEFVVSNRDTQILSITHRAFQHLQRLIIVDEDFAEKWRKAFDIGERDCEKLGAVHLLHHGIWAFKVDAKGGRTDLVLGTPLKNLDEVPQVADGLVLTEWKKVSANTNVHKIAEQALHQAELYAAGLLAGTELANSRYIVLVSNGIIEVPEDFSKNDVVYRHVNIAVNPEVPSVSARNHTRNHRKDG